MRAGGPWVEKGSKPLWEEGGGWERRGVSRGMGVPGARRREEGGRRGASPASGPREAGAGLLTRGAGGGAERGTPAPRASPRAPRAEPAAPPPEQVTRFAAARIVPVPGLVFRLEMELVARVVHAPPQGER